MDDIQGYKFMSIHGSILRQYRAKVCIVAKVIIYSYIALEQTIYLCYIPVTTTGIIVLTRVRLVLFLGTSSAGPSL